MNKNQRLEAARISAQIDQQAKELIDMANVEQSKLPENEGTELNLNQQGSKKVIPVILEAVEKIKQAQMILGYIADNSVDSYLDDEEQPVAKLDVVKHSTPESPDDYTVIREDEEQKKSLYIAYTINRKGQPSMQIFTASIETRLVMETIADVQNLSKSMLEIFVANNPDVKNTQELYCTIINWAEMNQ